MRIRLSELRSIIREELAAPGTRVYRCLCGVKPHALNRLLGSDVRPGGIVTMSLPPGRMFTPGRHRWWSTDAGAALGHLDRTSVNRRPGPDAYDVMIVGTLPAPMAPNGTGHVDLHGQDGITGLHIAYAPTGGALEDLKDALLRHE